MKKSQQGSIYAIVAILVIVVIVGMLSFIVYRSSVSEKSQHGKTDTDQSAGTSTPTKGFRILEHEGNLAMKYINYDYGIAFSFPERSIQPATCDISYVWKDEMGNDITAPLHYVSSEQAVDMTVATDGNIMTVVQKTAPFYEVAQHPSGRVYNTACELREVTAYDIANNAPVESRSWEIGRAKTKDDIAKALSTLPSFKNRKTAYTLGDAEGVRHKLTITIDGNEVPTAYKAWYYPDNELVVYIATGEKSAFRNPDDPTEHYLAEIVNSFEIHQE